jgi:hypothetical protein
MRTHRWKRFTWLDFRGPGLWRLPSDGFYIFVALTAIATLSAVSGEMYVNCPASIAARYDVQSNATEAYGQPDEFKEP